MFFLVWFVIVFAIYLLFLMIVEKLKIKDKYKNMLLGIELSIVGLILIAISAPNTEDNLYLYIEWIGVGVSILGTLIVQRFYRL